MNRHIIAIVCAVAAPGIARSTEQYPLMGIGLSSGAEFAQNAALVQD
jgi:hypothetical protein